MESKNSIQHIFSLSPSELGTAQSQLVWICEGIHFPDYHTMDGNVIFTSEIADLGVIIRSKGDEKQATGSGNGDEK